VTGVMVCSPWYALCSTPRAYITACSHECGGDDRLMGSKRHAVETSTSPSASLPRYTPPRSPMTTPVASGHAAGHNSARKPRSEDGMRNGAAREMGRMRCWTVCGPCSISHIASKRDQEASRGAGRVWRLHTCSVDDIAPLQFHHESSESTCPLCKAWQKVGSTRQIQALGDTFVMKLIRRALSSEGSHCPFTLCAQA
jgi:hypothetical protein